jgi:type IV pilus assembly protein PilA
MKQSRKQFGQGMTEYIIIVALVAIAGIAAYSFFGSTMRSSLGGVAAELAGGDATGAQTQAVTQSANVTAEGNVQKTLSTYDDGN